MCVIAWLGEVSLSELLSKEEQQQELKEVKQKPGAQIASPPALQKTAVPYGLSSQSAYFLMMLELQG